MAVSWVRLLRTVDFYVQGNVHAGQDCIRGWIATHPHTYQEFHVLPTISSERSAVVPGRAQLL